jgi:hypothetical protein
VNQALELEKEIILNSNIEIKEKKFCFNKINP